LELEERVQGLTEETVFLVLLLVFHLFRLLVEVVEPTLQLVLVEVLVEEAGMEVHTQAVLELLGKVSTEVLVEI
jgi:hypothetical protein